MTKRKKKLCARALGAALAVCCALLCRPAAAQPAEPKQAATAFFNAGVQAFEAGQFLSAGQAFLEAYKLFQPPELSFSIAQTFRKQFVIDQKPAHLKLAVEHYRRYLSQVKTGGRRADAVQGLAELNPFLAQIDLSQAVTQLKLATSVMISSSTSGAVVQLDDGPIQTLPFSREVKPGPHKLVVRATGHHEEQREVVAVEGKLAALDVPLRPKPALLQVQGADGAELSVDGRTAGTTPLGRPFELAAGRHFVTVTDRGHKPYAEELDFDNGALTQIDIRLPQTDQRTASQIVLAAGGAGIAAGIGLAVAAVIFERDALDIVDHQAEGTITEEQRLEHNSALQTRDDLVMAASIAAGAGGAVAITGLFLYLFDQPSVAPPPPRPDGPAKPPEDGEKKPGVEMWGAPALAPTMLGAAVLGRF